MEMCWIGQRNPNLRIVCGFVRRSGTITTNNTDFKYNPPYLFLGRTRYLHQELHRAANLLGYSAE
jgi:hypothetical protein